MYVYPYFIGIAVFAILLLPLLMFVSWSLPDAATSWMFVRTAMFSTTVAGVVYLIEKKGN